MFTLLAKLLGILNSDSEPKHIALAISLAMFAGFNSFFSMFGLITVILLIFFRANLSAFIALCAVFSGVSSLVASLLEKVGAVLLEQPDMQSFWTGLYQESWFRFVELNNSLVLGQFVMSLILLLPVYLLSIWLIVRYRLALKQFVARFKVVQSLKASKFYSIYQTVQSVKN